LGRRHFRVIEDERKEVKIVSAQGTVPTNEHIVRLLQAVRAELADSKKRQEQIARNVERLLRQKPA
jgi:hypothetical protein